MASSVGRTVSTTSGCVEAMVWISKPKGFTRHLQSLVTSLVVLAGSAGHLSSAVDDVLLAFVALGPTQPAPSHQYAVARSLDDTTNTVESLDVCWQKLPWSNSGARYGEKSARERGLFARGGDRRCGSEERARREHGGAGLRWPVRT